MITSIKLTKPAHRWLFGGIGFHNSEATMSGIMSEEFKNQVVLKCFREISPTYSRVFTGYADWTREDMDRFADYYDETFRGANTTLYLVPGRLPYRDGEFDMYTYAEKVASNLDYLINVRKCTKIRHYCVTNELAIGNNRKMAYHLDVFREMHEILYSAFRRHGLNVGLLALDSSSGLENPWFHFNWAIDNMDDTTECYCHHLYFWNEEPGDNRFYRNLMGTLNGLVSKSMSKEKRFVLGEFGFKKSGIVHRAMFEDSASYVNFPEEEGEIALQYPETCTAIINSGCLSACVWTLFDYPDPFLSEDGDTPEEKAKFDASRYSGQGISTRYNKNGMIRWSDEEKDYRAYAPYYTMGLMAKYFKKGSRVLVPSFSDDNLRISAVTNPDGSLSVCVVNYNDTAAELSFESEHKISKPLRRFTYDSKNPPYNDYNDLQRFDAVIEAENDRFFISVPSRGMCVLTTDYEDRFPTPVTGVRLEGCMLSWDISIDECHTYYRVFKNGAQVASTVANSIKVDDIMAEYSVYSVDKYGNCLA